MSGSQLLLLGGVPAAVPVDPYFYSVTSLLHGDGTNGGQNNTFLDSSTNNFTITRNGNTTQGSFSPFSQTGWSNYFTAASSGLYNATGSSSSIHPAASFLSAASGSRVGSIEAMVYVTAYPSAPGSGEFGAFLNFGGNYFNFGVNSSGELSLYYYSGSAAYTESTVASAIPLNQWTYVAAIFDSSNNVKLYVNGALLKTATFNGVGYASGNNTMNQMRVGRTFTGTTSVLQGYISNIRLVNGTAVTPTTPTTPFTAITNTSLLTCQSNRFIDNSSSAYALTIEGTPSVQPFSPFNPTTAYSTSSIGGSGYFDGSGDYLDVANNNTFDTNSTFTLECFFYQPSSGNATFFSRGGGTADWNTSTGHQFLLFIDTGTLYWMWNNSGTNTQISTTAPAAGQWHHIAVGYNGTTTRFWLNGASVGTSTTGYTLPTTRNIVRAGLNPSGQNPLTGYESNLRFVKGTDVYGVGNTTITVPTTPLTAITNTSLLLNYTNGAIFDNAAVADYETVGNAQISTSVKKYGTGSLAFDGTGDWLVAPASPSWDFGSGDFTVELWVNPSVITVAEALVSKGNASSVGNEVWSLQWYGTNQLAFFSGGGLGTPVVTTGSVFATGNWYHVAVCRTAGVTKIFVNGTEQGTSTTSYTITAGGALYVGAGWYAPASRDISGYIDDLRISKGVARYPYSFTPPTAAFPDIGGTVTLTADPYFENTTLLLPGNGTNGAQNNTFLDSSTNAFTITRNGNTTQGTFSPFSQTGWGNYFNGPNTGSYLRTPANTDFQLGTSDFTIEFWAYTTDITSDTTVCQTDSGGSGFFGMLLNYSNGTNITWYATSNGSSWNVINGGVLCSAASIRNTWAHFAYVRNGSTFTAYVNGTAAYTTTSAASIYQSANQFVFGSSFAGSHPSNFGGYLSNFRYVKGTAVYTSNFTPSTTPLTAITNTKLLSCQANRFIDSSASAHTLTVGGSPTVQAFSPFNPTASWSAATYGGSGYFDGSGDYLTATLTSQAPGTGDFTYQFWVYAADNTAVSLFDTRAVNNNTTGFTLLINGTSNLAIYTNSTILTGSGTVPLNAWSFVTVTRSGTTLTIYLDGTSQGTVTFSNNLTDTAMRLGQYVDGTGSFTGYIAGFKYVKGSADSASVPTTPPTATTGTQFLCNFTNAGIYDATSKNDLETVGNAQISTTQSKFGGSSMYFDGTGDYLYFPARQTASLGSGDWTIEFWVYASSLSGTVFLFDQRNTSTQIAPCIYIGGASNNEIKFFVNGADRVVSSTISASTWYHIALAKFGSSTKLFINGFQSGSTYSDTNTYVNNPVYIGAKYDGTSGFPGYIDDFRVTLGIARYTSNFTPPTTAFLTL